MYRFLFVALLFCGEIAPMQAQALEVTLPGVYHCPNDTFWMAFSTVPGRKFPYTVSRKDDISPGTDGGPGVYATIYYGQDSIVIPYHNRLPYEHIVYINFTSPKGKTTLRLHFNELICYFTKEQLVANEGQSICEIPEVFELANIIWALSPSGRRAKYLFTENEYYQEMRRWFDPMRAHPLMQALDFPDSVVMKRYYDFRENSFAFQWSAEQPDDTRLVFSGPYFYVYGDVLADSSLFGKLRPLIEDFAQKSNFRAFYKAHIPYYERLIRRQQQLVPLPTLWTWMEARFPRIHFNTYRIVFSPLISEAHSTQQYGFYDRKGGAYREAVMFVCGPESFDANPGLSETMKEGYLSGIVFTEIDHNYVNPYSNRFAPEIDSVFVDRKRWASPGSSADFYPDAMAVFNEYMTHSLFCLYALDHFDPETAEKVIQSREKLMTVRRGFTRFKDFNRQMMALYRSKPEMQATELYAPILQWCGMP